MSAYFKYTNGEAFLLNGSDYSGFFTVVDSNAYTGKLSSVDSEYLTPKNNFLSKLFLSKYELDTTYQNISSPTPYYSNVFDIFNKQELDRILGLIDNNNLLIFKSLILRNPNIYKFEDNDSHFYGLSSTDLDSRNDDLPSGKTGYTHIDPFSGDSVWGFMDDIKVGTFLVDTYENFKYICSDGTTNYTLSGSFVNSSPLAVTSVSSLPHPQYLHQIYNDEDSSRISFVYNDYINIYDSSNYADCDKLLLIDVIDLIPTSTIDYIFGITNQSFGEVPVTFNTRYITTNLNNPKFIKFGRNLRTSLRGDVLYLINKYSSEVYQSIDLSSLDVGNVLSLDIRQEDDNIIILHQLNDTFHVTVIDPLHVEGSYTKPIEGLSYFELEHSIKFSKTDSNVFYTFNKSQFQSRFLSVPTYPNARLENSDLLYLNDYLFGTTFDKFSKIQIKWNSQFMESNFYNNILSNEYISNNKMYQLLHNVGRLYALRQPYNDSYLTSIPMDLPKYYEGITCSESSFGLYFNSSISNLVKDTLNLYNQASNVFEISSDNVALKQLTSIDFDIKNLYLNGNETINIISIQRILLLITEIQKNLLSVSI